MAASMKTCISSCFITLFKFKPHACYFNNLSHNVIWRSYARGVRRRVENMLTPEMEREKLAEKGISVKDPSQNPYLSYIPTDPVQTNIKNSNKDKFGKKKSKDSDQTTVEKIKRQNKIFESEVKNTKSSSKYQYEKLDDGDKRFGKTILAAKSKPQREEKKIILLEGHRLINDGLKAGGVMKQLYFSDIKLLSDLRQESLSTTPLYKITYKQLKIWSDTQSPSGLMAIFEKPNQGQALRLPDESLPVTLICDRVRDPGNMGTLIRTAAAVGCQAVMAVKGCVDAWEPKVLRAGMGCHFNIPIYTGLNWDTVSNYFNSSSQIFIADTRQSHKITRGLDEKNADLFLDLAEDVTIEGSDVNTDEHREDDHDDDDSQDRMTKSMKKLYKKTPLPITSYDKLDVGSNVALIIGGETEGVSPEAKKMAFDRFGQIVTVPMTTVVNSLNTSIAAGVILYEIKRQMGLTLANDQHQNILHRE
ncbi:hypothetical protein SNE40_001870 [Patella caerulea]|uniref:Uncharacterized protein n=1 Tax=Patella caerulea TaxID=87958 RepID=A0AAN8KAT8_PATCE